MILTKMTTMSASLLRRVDIFIIAVAECCRVHGSASFTPLT